MPLPLTSGVPSVLDNLIVVLVATRNPLNIGAAARAMSNFGYGRLRLVRPYEPSWAEAKSAVGAGDVLRSAEVFDTVARAVSDCEWVVGTTGAERTFSQPVRRLDESAPGLRNRMQNAKVALLFGSEKTGLSNDDLSYCHMLLRIPTVEQHSSMNLGQAVAICLYELAQEPVEKGGGASEGRADSGTIERIERMLVEAMLEVGYTDEQRREHTEREVREYLRRHEMSATEASMWLKMLRKVRWRLRQ
jgi:TrmH family RNA methyltransferase